MANTKTAKRSSNGQIALTILLMFVFFPLGILLLIFWVKWGGLEKLLTTIVVLFVGIMLWGFISSALLVAINPVQKLHEAQVANCTAECQGNSDSTCITQCVQQVEGSR